MGQGTQPGLFGGVEMGRLVSRLSARGQAQG